MATIDERLARITSLSAKELKQLREDIGAEFDKAEEAEDIDAMEAVAVKGDILKNFEQLMASVNDVTKDVKLEVENESDAEVEVTVESGDDKDEDEKPAESDKDEDKADDKADTTSEAEVAEDAKNESEVPAMAASAVLPEAKDEGEGKELTPVTAAGSSIEYIKARPFAGHDLKGLVAGAEFQDQMDIASAMIDKIDQIRGTHGGDGEKRTVVSLRASVDEARMLTTDSIGNMAKIDPVAYGSALVASGGWCAPLPINYDIMGVGTTARPVRDSLPTFGATRGGIRYIQPPTLGAYNAAISLWTAENDATPTNPAVKPSLKVNCANELEATADAVTLSLIFGNFMSRAFPELVQRHNQLALIQHARFAERTLLNKISAASTPVTTSHGLGYGRDLLLSISQASAFYRNRHRIPRPVRLRAIMPEWVRDAVREDIATNLNVGTSDIAISDAQVDAWFASRGLNITWHLDDTLATQTSGAALNAFPTTIKWWLFAEGTFLFLDGGTLDLGVVRDSELIDTNDYRTFVETFEGIAKVGIEAMEITSTSDLGVAPAPVTP